MGLPQTTAEEFQETNLESDHVPGRAYFGNWSARLRDCRNYQELMSAADSEIFEKKRAEADFELVWARLSKMHFEGLKESYEYAYMAGRGAGKRDGLRKATAESYRQPMKEKV